MGNIKLTPTPELESRGIVAEQKSLDSRSIVAEPKIAKYDLDSLLSTPIKPTEPTPIVEKAPTQRKTSAAQLAATKKWNEKQSRMTFRMPPELRTQLDNHAAAMGESVTAFIIRAIKEQIKRDNAE